MAARYRLTRPGLAMQGLVAVGVALLPRMAVAMARRPGVALLPLSELAIERVTFVATRAGGCRSPLTEEFRAALRRAVSDVADPALPLEIFEPQHAVAAG